MYIKSLNSHIIMPCVYPVILAFGSLAKLLNIMQNTFYL